MLESDDAVAIEEETAAAVVVAAEVVAVEVRVVMDAATEVVEAAAVVALVDLGVVAVLLFDSEPRRLPFGCTDRNKSRNKSFSNEESSDLLS